MRNGNLRIRSHATSAAGRMREVRPSRFLATGIAVWMLVVALGSALVWVVIARAGGGVVSSESPVTTTTDQPDPGRTRTPRTRPSTPSATTEPTTEDPVRRTWQGPGGQVTIACRDAAASFVNAIPDSGFIFELDDRGPGRVRVEFERETDDDERSRIDASCVAGTPTFELEVDSD
ncbi:hypothetical protein [uncultured Nocardioides sp.]|uniref:hypothetical protein n=1 Tax=uncultured Nocardioides sp. TaxID=198441 RepID=UPI00261563E1|nr:hypothetical protein [uncultured Nocardioides sp.]